MPADPTRPGRARPQAERWKRRRQRDTIARALRLMGEPKPFEWQVRYYLAAERLRLTYPSSPRSMFILTGL